MEKMEILISVLGTALPLTAAIVTCIIKLIKSVKNGSAEHTKRLWNEFAQEAVEYAEALKGKHDGELIGETKKEIAMNKVESACVKNGVPFEKDKISAIIEGVVELTKKVNGRDKDKSNTIISSTQNIFPSV